MEARDLQLVYYAITLLAAGWLVYALAFKETLTEKEIRIAFICVAALVPTLLGVLAGVIVESTRLCGWAYVIAAWLLVGISAPVAFGMIGYLPCFTAPDVAHGTPGELLRQCVLSFQLPGMLRGPLAAIELLVFTASAGILASLAYLATMLVYCSLGFLVIVFVPSRMHVWE
jgi:hypothetical protein